MTQDVFSPLEAISPAEVRTVLRALRRASYTPSSPLLELEAVTEKVRATGLDASKDARFVALSMLLADTVRAALDRLRPATPSDRHRPAREATDDEAAWMARDFGSGNEVREAWSALQWHYFGPHTDLVTALKQLDIPYYTFRRRRLRGYELLAGSLRVAEVEAQRRRAAEATPSTARASAHPPSTVSGAPAPIASTASTGREPARASEPSTTGPTSTASPAPPGQPAPPARRMLRASVVLAAALAAVTLAALALRLLPHTLPWLGPPAGIAMPPAAATTRITVVGPMVIEPARPRVGETVTATFRVRNDADEPRTIARLKAGGRGPHACSRNWNAPNVDFPPAENVHLAPGASYLYRRTRVFAKAGDYFAEPVQLGASGRWGGIGPSPRAWFDVAERATGVVTTPDCLVVTQDIAVEPPVVSVGRPFTVTARLKNASNDVVRLRMLAVAMREPDARQGAWGVPSVFVPSERDVTLQPNEEIVYAKSRTATRAGVFALEVVVQQEEGRWAGVWPFGVRAVEVKRR